MNLETRPRISSKDLDKLMGSLEVRFVALIECLVGRGYSLYMAGVNAPGIHYNLAGRGRLLIDGQPPIELYAHTLVIVPPDSPFCIEAGPADASGPPKAVDGRLQAVTKGTIRYVKAGEGNPEVILICGFFDASYGLAIDLFGALSVPIVERFAEGDRLDETLGGTAQNWATVGGANRWEGGL